MAAEKTDDKAQTEDEKILSKAIKRFDIARNTFQDSNENAKTSLDFRILDQWPEDLRNARENDPDGARPCLVMDKLGQYVHQVVNDFRQQKTGILVNPVDGGADILVAEVYQDLIRRIENQSTAGQAYNWAFQCAVETGIGYWRVVTEYEHEKSFNQEIFIKKIPDIFSVVFDPSAIYSDGRDADYVFVITDMDKESFIEKYGKEAGEFGETIEEGSLSWFSEDKVRVAEYFYKEEVDVEIGITAEGFINEIGEKKEGYSKTRKTKKTIIKWCKITSSRILEKGLWPSKYFPIVRVIGDEHRVPNEGIFFQGMIYPAMDAQRMYNYAASSFVETVALSPKAPFVAAAGQIENFRDQWSQANRRNFSVLEYDPLTINGTLAPPPQRMELPGVPNGWQFVQQNMLADVQGSLGLFNSNLGQQSNERTGAAISTRKVQGEKSQYHFFENAAMAIEQTGKIIVDLIPKIYDTAKVMKIRGEDGMMKQVFINPEMGQAVRDKVNQYNDIIGKEVNPTIGSYDVVMEAGPSSATKRQETSRAMVILAQTSPQVMQVGGDILVGNMDFPGAQELAQRIFRTIPPEITSPNPEMSPQMAQMQQQIQMLSAENASLKAGHETTLQKTQMETQSRIQAETLKQQAETLRLQAQLEADKEVAMLQEAGKVKSSKISSKNEIMEEVVANIGAYTNTLIKQGFSPEQAEKMVGSFGKILKGEIALEIGTKQAGTEEEPELKKTEDKIAEPEEEIFVDEY